MKKYSTVLLAAVAALALSACEKTVNNPPPAETPAVVPVPVPGPAGPAGPQGEPGAPAPATPADPAAPVTPPAETTPAPAPAEPAR